MRIMHQTVSAPRNSSVTFWADRMLQYLKMAARLRASGFEDTAAELEALAADLAMYAATAAYVSGLLQRRMD